MDEYPNICPLIICADRSIASSVEIRNRIIIPGALDAIGQGAEGSLAVFHTSSIYQQILRGLERAGSLLDRECEGMSVFVGEGVYDQGSLD